MRVTLKLVGDNPFHGVSHLSQERAKARDAKIMNPKYAANLVKIGLENGADGFMFSVSDTTLSILRALRRQGSSKNAKLYAITPAAGEIARLMGPSGGLEGMVKKIAKQMILSGDLRAVLTAINGLALINKESLLHGFFRYEISRVKKASKKHLDCLMIHEIFTDMALSLNLKWFFILYNNFMRNMGSIPGYETRNFALLVTKFKGWDIDLCEVSIATPFNKVGFQMAPSLQTCEKALASLPRSNVIAISALAAGYLKPKEAFDYLKSLSNLNGIAVAVSNEMQAVETFRLLNSR